MNQKFLRIGFFLDGYTLKKVNEYYRNHHRYHANVDFKGIKQWLEMHLVKVFSDGKSQVKMECHYYHPHRNPHVYGSSACGVLKLEHQLVQAGFEVHYSNLPEDNGMVGPNLSLMEDALLIASYRKMDIVVLLSTQGQYTPLPDKLRMMGVPTVLLGWDFVYTKGKGSVRWRTDSGLRDTCAHYVAMEKVMDSDPRSNRPPRGFFFQRGERPFDAGRSSEWRETVTKLRRRLG